MFCNRRGSRARKSSKPATCNLRHLFGRTKPCLNAKHAATITISRLTSWSAAPVTRSTASTALVCFFVAIVASRGWSAVDESPRWIVVTAPAFRTAIEPLCEHRRSEGMAVRILTTTDIEKDASGVVDAVRLQEKLSGLRRER